MKCWENVPGIPRSQPWMKEPAMARTSLGARARSKDAEMAVALSNMFSMVPWRDSIVTMEAAAVRTRGSSTRCAAPRYAAMPTCSMSRALEIMVSTSVSTAVSSNLQPEGGVPPNEVIIDWGPRIVKEMKTDE